MPDPAKEKSINVPKDIWNRIYTAKGKTERSMYKLFIEAWELWEAHERGDLVLVNSKKGQKFIQEKVPTPKVVSIEDVIGASRLVFEAGVMALRAGDPSKDSLTKIGDLDNLTDLPEIVSQLTGIAIKTNDHGLAIAQDKKKAG